MGRILKTNNMKKKIIIAYPISLGMIGGFSLGFFVAMKN